MLQQRVDARNAALEIRQLVEDQRRSPGRPQRSTAYSMASLQPENRVRASRESSNVRASSRVNNRSASGAVLSGHAKNRSGLPAPNCRKSAVLPSLRRP